MNPAYSELTDRWCEIQDIRNGLSILGWDQEVMMPPGGAGVRAHTLATLSGISHEKLVEPSLQRLVRKLSRKDAGLTPRQRRSVELVQHEVRKATAIPPEMARELALAESHGLETWRAARESKRFAKFVPALSRMVDLKREVARLRSRRGQPYDALLDDFEPGATMRQIDPLLDALKAITVPLLDLVRRSGVKVDMAPFVGRFDIEAQRAFARQVATAMGIDLDRGRIDLSTHPFCGGIGPDDVRMTSRYDPRDMRGGLFGAIHEAGHGLYEQGLDPKRGRTPLGGAISMAIHESQSRLWENNVGRSRAFWRYWLPRLRRAHPSLKGITLDTVHRAANEVRPSMIRVEADELTYNLHIILRYEIERDLIEGRVEVKDLPGLWNDTMHELLGITPRHDAEGVLQDIHWAMGLFGYFPTYSIGNLYAAQWMETARRKIRNLEGRIAKGQLAPLRDWLATEIHRHDQVYTADQIVKRVTGKPLGTDAFERYITAKVTAVYG